jgi:hypothetical protein
MKAFVKKAGRSAGKVTYKEIAGKTNVLVVMELLYILQRRVWVYLFHLYKAEPVLARTA